VQLHWLGHRSFPCFGPECPLDHKLTPWRWHGYLAFLVPQERRPSLVGVPAGALGPLDALEGELGGLRGVKLKLSRATPGHGGRVLVEVLASEKATGLPPGFPVESHLLYVWGLDPAMPPQIIESSVGTIDVPTILRLRLLVGDLFDGKTHQKGGDE
jgi:hypothetical protein